MSALMLRTSSVHVALFSIIALGSSRAASQSVSNMYDRAAVAREEMRLRSHVNQVWTTAFAPNLTPDEQRALSGVTIQTPLDGDPVLGYFSDSRSNVVTTPAISLLFFEDLCTGYAWLYRRGYRLEPIEEYVSMLKYKDVAAFGGRFPAPRKALGIPDDALNDQGVNDLSLRLRNSGYAFILGHELGHLRFRHPGYKGVPAAVAQANEAQADQFALELMRRTRTIPMGAMLFFQSAIYYFENRADFPSQAAWQSYLANKATHPLTAGRLRTLSNGVRAMAEDFGRGQANRSSEITVVRFIGDQFAKFATFLDDPEQQRVMRAKAERSAPSTLLPRRERETVKDFSIR